MLKIQTTLRDLIFATIVQQRNEWRDFRSGVTIIEPTSEEFVKDFEIEASYFPQENLEDLASPRVKLVCIGFSSNRDRILRNRGLEVEIPIQIAIQQRIDPKDVPAIDVLVELVEQMESSCENDYPSGIAQVHGYSWLRTEPLRDENGLAYSYQDLTTEGVFQAVFIPFYKHIMNRPC